MFKKIIDITKKHKKLLCRGSLWVFGLIVGLVISPLEVFSPLRPVADNQASLDRLRALLRDQKWAEASKVTSSFPSLKEPKHDCDDLTTIESLWRLRSKEQYGYIEQLEVWDDISKSQGNYKERYEDFARDVGWIEDDEDEKSSSEKARSLEDKTKKSSLEEKGSWKNGFFPDGWRLNEDASDQSYQDFHEFMKGLKSCKLDGQLSRDQ